MKTRNSASRNHNKLMCKFGLFGPRLTYSTNHAICDTVIISLFFVMVYIRFKSLKLTDSGFATYGFYCMKQPDMFIIEWGNRYLKRIEMPWTRIIVSREVKTITDGYHPVSTNDIMSLHEMVNNNSERYVKTDEIWGCTFKYIVVKNTYAIKAFKDNQKFNKVRYEVFVDIITPSIKESRLIFETYNDSSKHIIEKIGTEILTIFISGVADDYTK